MNHLTRSKVIVALTAIFVAGGISGGVVAWKEARQELSRPPSPKKYCEHLRDKLRQELSLTEEQVKRLDPLLDKRARDMEAVHQQTIREFEMVRQEFNREMVSALALTEKQESRLQEMEKNRQEWMRKNSRKGDDRGESTDPSP